MITPQKMEITSLPGPDRTISDTDLKKRKMISKRYRNRRIGDYLKKLKLVEGRNTGIPTMLRAMRNNGSEPPEFLTDPDRTYFTVVLPVHPSFLPGRQSLPFRVRSESLRISDQQMEDRVLSLLKENGDMSSSQIASAFGYKKVTSRLSSCFRKLLCENRISYTDPEHLHSRNQKLHIIEQCNMFQKMKHVFLAKSFRVCKTIHRKNQNKR